MKQFSLFVLLEVMFSILSPIALAEECTPSTTAISLKLEISALYPNPADGEDEWIEIRNLGKDPVELDSYTLEDATGKPWKLSGTLEESRQISGFPFQLNNSDEKIILKTVDGQTIDTFSYSKTTKGEVLKKNAVEQSAPTEVTENTPAPEETVTKTPSKWPVFSEALPNPEGSDSTDEWIELYNKEAEELDLTGLFLDDAEGGSKPYELKGYLAAESYLVIYVTESKLTLNNDSDHIRLLGVQNEILWDVTYPKSKEGQSYADFQGVQEWTTEPTPGEENRNALPEGSENGKEDSKQTEYQNGDLSDEVEISEVFPNPSGPDNEEEWVEITNGGDIPINLGNWILDDGEGGSDPYTIPDDTVVEPGETVIFYRTETGIALNNSKETVRLIDYTGEVTSEVYYESSEEDKSYSEIEVEEVGSEQASVEPLGNRHFSLWQWSTPTPGEINPVWKQIKGEVTEWDGSILTLFDGITSWSFKTADGSETDSLVFKIGNNILVQAASFDGFYTIMHSELLDNGGAGKPGSFPWTYLSSGFLAAAWVVYELYKKRKSLQSAAGLIS